MVVKLYKLIHGRRQNSNYLIKLLFDCDNEEKENLFILNLKKKL